MGSPTYSKLAISVLASALATAASLSDAHAQSSTAQAETLFREAKDLLAKGKIGEACDAFDASQKLDPTIATLLNQASCREKNGQLATAWGLFLDAERQSRAATDDAGRQLHQVATDHAAKLESRLSTLTITVSSENRVGGLEILRNTEPVEPGAWNKALPVDGGTYKITARAPGNAEWASTITIGTEHDAKTIEIPKLKAAALTSQNAAPAQSTPAAPDGAATAQPRPKLVPLILAGAAVALGAGAIGFDLSASSTYDKSKAEPDPTKQTSLYNSANSKRYVAEGLGAAAVVSLGAAIFVYVRSGHAEAASGTETSQLILAPVVGTDRAGLVLQGSY